MTATAPPPLDAVLEILCGHGHDLRGYVPDVLQRRLAEHVEVGPTIDPEAVLASLRADAAARERMVQTLMVSASQFFRDVELFRVLRESVIAQLGRAAPRGLRVWVAGAATGEEAWSIAMVLAEAEARGGPPWEVFASDRAAAPLALARRGHYPAASGARIPAALRGEYAIVRGDELVIADALRPRVRFCQHDLLGPRLAPSEAVLARFDLVLCCNVLIYLERHLQVRLLERLLSVVAPRGALGLGAHEQPAAAIAARLRRYPGVAQPVHLFALEASA